MDFQSELVQQGNWLFRWRSYLPIAFLVPLAYGIATMCWPFESYAFHEFCEMAALGVSLFGVLVRAITVGHTPAGTSGRNTHGQVAEELNTTGIYATVRHPLYVGNFLIGFGVVMVPMELWLMFCYTLAFWLYYERIVAAEEAFLRQKFGDAFDAWAQRTPTFIPKITAWTKPSLPFSLRNVLKREYTALALVVLCHTMIEAIEHPVVEHQFIYEPFWATLLTVTLIAYFLLRYLKRHSTLLQVEGR